MIVHSAILTRLAELRATAEALPEALREPWEVEGLSWAEQVAARHVSDGHERAPSCKGCGWDSLTEDWIESWPCPDIAGLASALGLEETA